MGCVTTQMGDHCSALLMSLMALGLMQLTTYGVASKLCGRMLPMALKLMPVDRKTFLPCFARTC